MSDTHHFRPIYKLRTLYTIPIEMTRYAVHVDEVGKFHLESTTGRFISEGDLKQNLDQLVKLRDAIDKYLNGYGSK